MVKKPKSVTDPQARTSRYSRRLLARPLAALTRPSGEGPTNLAVGPRRNLRGLTVAFIFQLGSNPLDFLAADHFVLLQLVGDLIQGSSIGFQDGLRLLLGLRD